MVSASIISCLSVLWLTHAATSTPLVNDQLGLTGAASLVARQDNNAGAGSPTCLNPAALQTASSFTGQEEGTEGIKPGQAPSATDNANFMNFCAGKQVTNGMQITSGSCNGIPMGRIPAVTNMISAIITNPQTGDQLPAGTPFNISVQTQNLAAGFFVNPTTNYYTAPQDLDDKGNIIGHCHVTVQDIGDLGATTPPNPATFVFFKGIDDRGDGQGLLQAVVDKGLPVGTYRVCTMIAARNHQPVNMPVAQRGAQDDCTKFQVVASGNGGNQGAEAGNQVDQDMGRVIADPENGEPTRGEQGTGEQVGDGAGQGGGGQQGGDGQQGGAAQQGGDGAGQQNGAGKQGENGDDQQGGGAAGQQGADGATPQGGAGTGQQGEGGAGQQGSGGANGTGQQGGGGGAQQGAGNNGAGQQQGGDGAGQQGTGGADGTGQQGGGSAQQGGGNAAQQGGGGAAQQGAGGTGEQAGGAEAAVNGRRGRARGWGRHQKG